MADAADLKSAEGFLLYGFESRLRHHHHSMRPHPAEPFSVLPRRHLESEVDKRIAHEQP